MKTARLVAHDSGRLRSLSLTKDTITIGSAAGNDFVLEDSSVSRTHARIDRVGTEYRLIDLDSSNGTFVAGKKLQQPHLLREGDAISFGRVALLFQPEDAPSDRSQSFPRAVLQTAEAVLPPAKARRRPPHPVLVAFATLAFVFFGFALTLYLLNWDQMENAPEVSEAPRTKAAPTSPRPVVPESIPIPATAKTSAAAKAGIATLNFYRSLAGVPAVEIDASMTAADITHSRYLVRNFAEQIKTGQLGALAHTEDPALPGYTPEGRKAAEQSDIDCEYFPPGMEISLSAAEDLIAVPFHRLNLLNPQLKLIGYGQYCENRFCAAGLNVSTDPAHVSLVAAPSPVPITFPPKDSHLKMRDFKGEWPNPLSACPGYTAPAGLPITLQLGPGIAAKIGGYSLIFDGTSPTAVASCAFDADTYTNPVPAEQALVRNILKHFGAAVLVPRQPLKPGNYTVSLTLDHPYTWTFTIE